MKTISEIYQAGRDIDGKSHSIVTFYSGPKSYPVTGLYKIKILFPGYAGNENRDKFIALHCKGYQVEITEQSLTIHY